MHLHGKPPELLGSDPLTWLMRGNALHVQQTSLSALLYCIAAASDLDCRKEPQGPGQQTSPAMLL